MRTQPKPLRTIVSGTHCRSSASASEEKLAGRGGFMSESKSWQQLRSDWQQLVADLSAVSVEARATIGLFPARLGRTTLLFAELEDLRCSWTELSSSAAVQQNRDRYLTSQWTVKDL